MDVLVNILRKLFVGEVASVILMLAGVPDFAVVAYRLVLGMVGLRSTLDWHLRLRTSRHLSFLFEVLDLLVQVLSYKLE